MVCGWGAHHFLTLAMAGSLGCGLCQKQQVAESKSPGGGTRAVLFLMNCGASTGYTIHVALLRREETLASTGRGVFVAEDTSHSPGLPGFPAGAVLKSVATEWKSDSSLSIRYEAKAKVARRDSLYRGITIRYEVEQP